LQVVVAEVRVRVVEQVLVVLELQQDHQEVVQVLNHN
jgi:hypothetical protein